MKVSEAYGDGYLAAGDLPHAVTVQIRCVEWLPFRVGRGVAPLAVVYFVNKKRGLVLDGESAFALARAFGDDTTAWPGGRLTLTPAGETIEVTVPDAEPRPAAA